MDAGPKAADIPLYRYRFGTAEFDEARFDLRVGGLGVELERRPLEVLAFLLRHAGEVVTKEELLEAVWAGRITVENVLANAVLKLRKALGEANARLIHTQARVGYRLEGPVERVAVGRAVTSRLELKAGEPVPGRPTWVLERQLSSSHANEVWVALHAKTRSPRVFKFSPDGSSLATLKREATLARVLRESLGDREDIARILDWNFEQPPYFLECEYGGENLLEWAAAEDRLAGMDAEARIALFLQIVDAVAVAHGVGILHKDLKPANVLVARKTEGWQVRITDFGSSKLLEPGRLAELGITMMGMTQTQAGGVDATSGTPLYLAPELIAGRAPTVQSDVFALGILLFQLLAGDFRRPMASGWERDVADEMVREDLAQATDGSPTRRIATAAEFARRLRRREQRRVERERDRQAAIQARDTMQALERSKARRPWVIAALVLLAVGAGVSLWMYHGADLARQAADRETARLETVNRFLNDDLLAAADPTAPGSTNNPTIREVLERAGARLDRRFAGDPLALATLHLTLGKAWSGLSDYAAAVEHDRRATELLVKTRGPADPSTLEAKYQLAIALAMASEFAEAGPLLDATDREAGERIQQRTTLALLARWARASFLRLQQRNEDAMQNLQAAEALRRAVAPDDDLWQIRLLDALGDCYLRLGRTAEAREALAPLLDAQWPPERIGPVRWATVRLRYAAILKSVQQLDEAETLTQAALAQLEKAVGPDHYFVAVALNQIADLRGLAGRWSEALEPSRRADAIVRARLGEKSQTALLSRVNLGVIEFQSGQYPEAAIDLAAGREGLIGLLGAQSPQAQGGGYYLAATLSELGKQEEAWQMADTLDPAALASSVSGEGWEPRLAALKGQIELRRGHREQGIALLEPAVAEMEQSGMQDYVLLPYRKALAQAKAVP